MTDTTDTKQNLPSPLELWVTVSTEPGETPDYRIYGPGEALIGTDQLPGVGVGYSPSVWGAEREITADLVQLGYTPLGRWVTQIEDHGDPIEAYGAFKLDEGDR